MYGKVFEQLYDSTLAVKAREGAWEVMALWPHMIALADRNGDVDMPMAALSNKIGLPLSLVEKAISVLEEPDPDSRSPAEGGRRITRLHEHCAWGWHLTNYESYAKIRSADDRREYMRTLMKEKRALANVSMLADVDTDIDVKNTVSSGDDTLGVDGAGFEEFWAAYPSCARKVNKRGCLNTWKSRKLGRDKEAILLALEIWKKSEPWTREHDNCILLPKTFLNQDRWLTPPIPIAPKTRKLIL